MVGSLRGGGFARNVAELASGTALAQLAPLLVMPFLTRMYTPVQFGEFGVFSALLLGLSIIASGRYEIAVPLPASSRTAFELLVLSVLIAAAFSGVLMVLALVGIAFFGELLSTAFETRGVAVLLLPVGVLAASLMQSFSYWLTRRGRFSLVARARVTHGIVTAVLSVGFGMAGASTGLILSVLGGYLGGALIVLGGVLASDAAHLRTFETRRLIPTMKEYREFPLLNGGNAALDALRESGMLLLVTALFGGAVTGFLSQTLRLLRAPVSLIGQAVAQVYYPAVGKKLAEGLPVRELTAQTMRGVIAVSVPLYTAVLVSGPWLFGRVLGEEWVTSGVYARILSPWLMLVLVLSSLSLLPVALNVQHKALALNVVETIARFTGLLVGASIGGPVGAVGGIAAAGLLTGTVQSVWYWILSGKSGGPRVAEGDVA